MIDNLKHSLKHNPKHSLEHSLIKLKKIKLIKRKRLLSVCGVCCFSMKEFEYQLNKVMNIILGDDAKISI